MLMLTDQYIFRMMLIEVTLIFPPFSEKNLM